MPSDKCKLVRQKAAPPVLQFPGAQGPKPVKTSKRPMFVSVAAELCPTFADLCKSLGVILCNQPEDDDRAGVTLQAGRRSTCGLELLQNLQTVRRYGHIQATPTVFRS